MYDKMSYKYTDFLSFFYLIKLSIYYILYIGMDFVFIIANNLNIIYAWYITYNNSIICNKIIDDNR